MITKYVNMKENSNLIKLFNCMQIVEGLPIYEGTCSKCGEKVQVVESWVAAELSRQAHNNGLKKGIMLGVVAALFGIATTWAIGKIVTPDQKDKED